MLQTSIEAQARHRNLDIFIVEDIAQDLDTKEELEHALDRYMDYEENYNDSDVIQDNDSYYRESLLSLD